MCGLFASVGFPPDRDRIGRVAHRGPDGEGWREWASPAGPVALGHRRLAVIDVRACALQPMADGPGRRHLVFNGEIYNYLELRDELAAKGHVFRTLSDSEVLLAAFAEWGEACLDRFLGMWAFVIWDEASHSLFAARDRFGIKPLYWAETRGGVAFASEIKQLLGLQGLPGGANIPRLLDFLAGGLADHTAETMFAGIRQLGPGECLRVDAARPLGAPLAPRRWYRLPEAPELAIGEREAADRYRALLEDAVRLHLRSDVPVGSCLSGGLDSSSVVCLAARELAASGGPRPTTVTAIYEGSPVDERLWAERVVAATGAASRLVSPRPEDVLATASDLTWHQDEPFGSTSVFAQFSVFAEARRAGLTVMLDGQGADEPLAGYHGAFPWRLRDLLGRGDIAGMARTLAERRRVHGVGPLGDLGRLGFLLLPEPLRRAALGLRDREGAGWLGGEAARAAPRPAHLGIEEAASLAGLPRPTDLGGYCRVQTASANLQMLLHWEDRSAMAHGIEARVPFLDHRLVEFSLALGGRHKIVGAETKRVLREAMRGILPEPVRTRQDKIGFATPETAWFRGPLQGAMRDGVEATLRRFPGLFDAARTRALADAMLSGRQRLDFRLWRIVNLGIWGERFSVSA